MALSLVTTISGSPTQVDKRAALHAIEQANQSRETPLPFANNTQIASSYKTILDGVLADIHSHNLSQANQQERAATAAAFDASTDEVRAQIKTLLGL